ncbi:hypothetical protein V1511DRAFT_487879 [Dipodascopsis uninucleata]
MVATNYTEKFSPLLSNSDQAPDITLAGSHPKCPQRLRASRFRAALLSSLSCLLLLYTVCTMYDGSLATYFNLSAQDYVPKSLHKRDTVKSASTIESKYFCIPKDNVVYNPTFSNYADGWSRNNESTALFEMIKWPDHSAAGIVTQATPFNTSADDELIGTGYQIYGYTDNMYRQLVSLVGGVEYTIRASFTPRLYGTIPYSAPVFGVFLFSGDYNLVSLHYVTDGYSNDTISTVNFTVSASATATYSLAFVSQLDNVLIYLHSLTLSPSSDTSCSADAGYSMSQITAYEIPSMAGSFCVPQTNILSNPHLAELSEWSQPSDSVPFLPSSWYDNSAMGAHMQRLYNYTNPYASILSQTKPKGTFTSGQYILEIVYSIYQVSEPLIYSPVKKEATLNFTISLQSDTTSTLLSWSNTTLDSDSTNQTSTFARSLYLDAEYDATVSILAESTLADIYIHTVSLYLASDSSCSGQIRPDYSYGFPIYSTSNMSSTLCIPTANAIVDPLFTDLGKWSITPAYEGSLMQTSYSDDSAAGIVITALTPEQFSAGVTTTVGVKVPAQSFSTDYTLVVALSLVPHEDAPSVPEYTYYCHVKGNSTDDIWQGHVHNSMSYNVNYVDETVFDSSAITGYFDIRCHFAATNADIYIFSYELMINDGWIPGVLGLYYCRQNSYDLFKVSGRTNENILY